MEMKGRRTFRKHSKEKNQFKKEEKGVRLRYKIMDGSRRLFSSHLDLKDKFLRECLTSLLGLP